jgi:hypothetical protein
LGLGLALAGLSRGQDIGRVAVDGLLDITPDAMRIDLRAVSDQTDPASKVSSLARFAIEAGRPGARIVDRSGDQRLA